MNKLSELIMRHGPPIGDEVEHHKREAELWRKRYEALTEMIAKNAFMHTHPAVTLMAEPESFKAGEQLAERKMLQLFTDPENQPTQHGTVTVEYMQREIAAEREACAKLCESLPTVGELRQLERATMKDCAVAIRARGQQ